MAGPCAYPLFRKQFLSSCEWMGSVDAVEAAAAGPPSAPTLAAAGRPALNSGSLRSLDLRALAPEDNAPSESRMRRQKMAFFEKHCSEVAEGLCIAGDYVARSVDVLRAHGITHIVNCVGFLYQEYWRPEMAYKTLYLQGARAR